jgi:hypothetical protein
MRDDFISISSLGVNLWKLLWRYNWQASPLYDGCRTKSLSGDPNPRRGKFPAPS